MNRRQLAEMTLKIENRYTSNSIYCSKFHQPVACLNIDKVAAFNNGLQAINRNDHLCEMYKTNRDVWGEDGNLYGFYQSRFI
jgi:hypothetical protein